MNRHALVAGVTGLVGRRIAECLVHDRWRVTGLCRTAPRGGLPYTVISVDLTDAAACRRAMAPLRDVTHLFYAARFDHPEGQSESVDVNAAMLVNLVDAVEPVAPGLQHVHLVHGTKHYGHMLGPLTLPLAEESPRARVPNFYFAHEDFIRERQRRARWRYSIARPHTFCDASEDEPRNAALLIAAYATLARALEEPLVFPGSEASFHARTQFTYVPMLARAARWMALTPACANQAYNIVNGDAPRWSELWPAFAEYFGVECGGPTRMRLADYVADKASVWEDLVRRWNLQRVTLNERVAWRYAEYLFAPEWDIISSTAKARADGYAETVNSPRMFREIFDCLRSRKIVP